MKSGEFSLELINAETKEPMTEFVAQDGKVYAEAEPDLEYFIRRHRERPGNKKKGKTTVQLQVDGANLGYNTHFSTKTCDLGLWKQQNGVNIYRALRFVLKRTRGAGGSSSSSNTTPVGSVSATFYETIEFDEMVERKDHDYTNRLNQPSASAPAVASSGAKKAFASVSGSAIVSTASGTGGSRLKRKRRRGKRLGEMTIHYTSALGLSQLGILAPIVPVAAAAAAPDDINSSALARRTNIQHNVDDDDDPVIAEQPERKKVKTEPTRSSDLVDLTGNGGGIQSDNFIDLTNNDD